MPYSLQSAATACGVNRSTILRAIKSGKISATKDDTGAWVMEPVEVRRVYPLVAANGATPVAVPDYAPPGSATDLKTQVSWTGRYVTGEQTPDGLKITSHVDAATSEALNGTDRVYLMRVEGNKLIMKSPGVIVPMTGATSIVDIELTKAQ